MNIQKQLDDLANDSLEMAETRESFSAVDLANISVIFQRVISNLHYDELERRGVSMDVAIEHAIIFGQCWRKLVKEQTGIDLHEAVKQYQYEELNDQVISETT